MALVLAPSRELAVQIYHVIRPVARGFKTVAFYGGHRMSHEVSQIATAPADIIIATPGRLIDHLEHNTTDLSNLKVLIIDEYDKSLELGFSEQMEHIAHHVPKPRLIALTSATPLDKIPDYIDADQATTIDFTDTPNNHLPAITIMSVPSPTRDKLETLAALLRSIHSDKPSIVFVNHREIAVAALNSGAVPVLVATDLAGRGLDIQDLGAAIHYHMPPTEQAWTHRNGRTARAGRRGEVYVIIGPDEDIPEFIVTDNDYYPDMTATDDVDTDIFLLYIDAGRRDKISKGDIVGWAIKQAGLTNQQLGHITIGADYALLAVTSRDAAYRIIETSRETKLKNHRVRVTPI